MNNKILTILLLATIFVTMIHTYCIANLLCYCESQNRIEVKEVAIIESLAKSVWGEVTK
jgi:hypothetical protein